jgi:hypothetical protein
MTTSTEQISDIDRYIFDTQGYLIVEDVLASDEVQRMKEALPRNSDGSYLVNDLDLVGFPIGYPDPLYREIINHQRIVPYLRDFLCNGRNPWDRIFHLNHNYGLYFNPANKKGLWFHGGGTPHCSWTSYIVRDGKIFCGLIAVVWCLTDVKEGDGGFWCIPGSHKSNFATPEKVEKKEITLKCTVQPAVRAGSVIIFTEALTHGTRDWVAPYERIALFYKYTPGVMHAAKIYPPQVMKLLNEEQRKYVAQMPARHPMPGINQ